MSPVFEIIPEAIFFQQTNLICEISRDGFCYVFENDIDKKFYGLSAYHFTDVDIPGQLKAIFKEQPLLNKNYKKVFVSYSGKESALLPEELYKQDENDLILNTLHGDLCDSIILTDLVTDKKIYNIYRMPAAIHQVISNQFPLAVFTHQYSFLLKQQFTNADLLKVIFYRDTFIAALIKAGELQIIQTYPYKAGTDVVYHLLNICQQFKIINVPVRIGGMIETDADLHKEISHYFKNVSFDELPAEYEFTNGLKELPPHYFSHLFSLASCV